MTLTWTRVPGTRRVNAVSNAATAKRINVALAVVLLGTTAGCAGQPTPTPTQVASSPGPAPSGTPVRTGAQTPAACAYEPAGTPAKPVDPPDPKSVPRSGEAVYTLAMSEGEVKLALDRANAPCAAASFESLAGQGFFDGTTCHRLVDHGIFILQCGDPTGTGKGGPGYVFADELTGTETYPAGTVAMANAGPDTNGSQFFIVYQDSQLPPDYTVFGHIDGQSIYVIASIGAQGVDASASPRPISEARIVSVTAG